MRFTSVVPLATSPAITRAAEARRSLAITGAPLKGRPPFTIALGPSMAMSAPNRVSSLTCMKRDSKIRSVIMLMPGVNAGHQHYHGTDFRVAFHACERADAIGRGHCHRGAERDRERRTAFERRASDGE